VLAFSARAQDNPLDDPDLNGMLRQAQGMQRKRQILKKTQRFWTQRRNSRL
jgi:hypothetical protein